jgi:hypothetical protein
MWALFLLTSVVFAIFFVMAVLETRYARRRWHAAQTERDNAQADAANWKRVAEAHRLGDDRKADHLVKMANSLRAIAGAAVSESER